MSQLALLGGAPVIDAPLPTYRSTGAAELEAVTRVMRSDCLSGFYGSPGPEFLGGPEVRAFEAEWCTLHGVRHAVSMNSNTSGLFAAMAAIGIGPGDEVIVPPWTMSATVVAPLHFGGIPVFADVEDETFCIDPRAVRAAVTERTRAIVAVNLFGHPARLAELRAIADERGIFLIEDTAQAPLGHEGGRRCGTIGHIGVFSLNFHKHIHTGEGGMCVTDDEGLARRLQLVRNHAENAVEGLAAAELANMIGFNFRMTELSAAVGRAQLARIDEHVETRERIGAALTAAAGNSVALVPPVVRVGCRHNYYCWTARFDAAAAGVDRATFSRALAAEGFPHAVGYVPPLYTLPLFRERVAIGGEGFPFTLTERRYAPGLCPVAERLHQREALLFEPCAYALDDVLLARLGEALAKVLDGLGELAGRAGEVAAAGE